MSERSLNMWIVVALSLLSGAVMMAWEPVLAVPGMAVPLLGFGFSKPIVRLLWFLAGAMALLNTSSQISLPKLTYMAGTAVCVLVAMVRLSKVLREPWARRFRPAAIASAVWIAWILVVTLPHAVWIGTGLVDWTRDAFTQLLLPAGVLIGIDATSALRARLARGIALLAGGVGAVQFAITWASRRALTEGDAVYLFGSKSLIAVPVAVGLVYALTRPGVKWVWLAYGSGALASVLLTGSRSGLLFSSVYLGIVGAREKCRVPVAKAVFTFVCAVGIVLIMFEIAAPALTGSAYVTQRMSTVLTIIQTRQVDQDMSGRIRLGLYRDALDTFQASPFMGGGVGSSTVVDTPLIYLAKFGLLGTMVLLFVLWAIARSCVSSYREPWFQELTIARGAFVCWVCLLPSGAPTQDKGFGLALALLVILVGTGAKANQPLLISEEQGARHVLRPSREVSRRGAFVPRPPAVDPRGV